MTRQSGMKQIFMGLLGIFIWFVPAEAQQLVLKFNQDGKFKIVQFTDIHFKYGNPKSEIALERMKEVLKAEKPDLVIFTGDLIYAKPAEAGIKKVLELVSMRKIPFAVVFGNHDDEQGISRILLYDIICRIPYNLTAHAEDISGVTNFVLPVKSRNGKRDAAVLYCLDSHAYSSLTGVEGYDYLKWDQIQWYRENSCRFTARNENVPLPSLAFFHIPLPEYREAASDDAVVLIGTRKEPVGAPRVNSGMFTAMKEQKDILGIFVGHDHNNDFVAYWKGILLGYGRYTGGNTVYHDLTNGARIIELEEGKRKFRTWICLQGGKCIQEVNYPADFLKGKN